MIPLMRMAHVLLDSQIKKHVVEKTFRWTIIDHAAAHLQHKTNTTCQNNFSENAMFDFGKSSTSVCRPSAGHPSLCFQVCFVAPSGTSFEFDVAEPRASAQIKVCLDQTAIKHWRNCMLQHCRYITKVHFGMWPNTKHNKLKKKPNKHMIPARGPQTVFCV